MASFSEGSTKVASEAADIGRSAFYPASGLSSTFGFKIQDKQGRMHRFNCGMHFHFDFMHGNLSSFLPVSCPAFILLFVGFMFHITNFRHEQSDRLDNFHFTKAWR
jgi:hypothetical protein